MFNLVVVLLAVGYSNPTRWYGPSIGVIGAYRTKAACEKAAAEFRPEYPKYLGLGGAADQVGEIRMTPFCQRTDARR